MRQVLLRSLPQVIAKHPPYHKPQNQWKQIQGGPRSYLHKILIYKTVTDLGGIVTENNEFLREIKARLAAEIDAITAFTNFLGLHW